MNDNVLVEENEFDVTDIVIDLETLGTSSNAAILSIGAVMVDRVRGKIEGSFYAALDIDEVLRTGGVCDGSTIQWWMKQGDAAKSVFGHQTAPVQHALVTLADWMLLDDDGVPPKDIKVWGNGDTFDNVILSNMFTRMGLKTPWHYWNNRDLRTAVDISGVDKKAIPFDGTQHNALEDAKHQAKILLRCLGADAL